jgi:aldehyde dehydrogenase (NAD+)/aldehyde dehydrogenase
MVSLCVFACRIPRRNFWTSCALTTFSSTEEAIAIANIPYGLGAGVWSRDAHELFQVPRAIQAGRVGKPIQYVSSPCPFGGVKESVRS